MPSAHSEFSPSGSGRWIACPGSIQAIRELNVEGKPSIYAEEGTAAHELGERVLNNPNTEPSDYIGQIIYEGQQKWKVDHEMAEAVSVYTDHILAHTPNPNDLHVEMRVNLEHLHPGTFGTADAVIVNELMKKVIVGDYKHGKGVPVEVENNSQLMLYAIGVLMWLVEKGYDLDDFETIELHIIQPRCPHPDGPIRVWHTTVDELKAFSKKARKAIINACSDDPHFEAGEKQCQWCDFAPMCTHLARYSLELAQNEFADFVVEPQNIKDINSLTKEQISHIMQRVKVIDHWVKAMTAFVQSELEKGRGFPDYKLVRGRANRIWGEEAETKLMARIADGSITDVDRDDFYTTKFKTPAQAEAVLGRKRHDEIKDLIVKPDGKLTIAHISDKRPSVTPTADAENEFGALLQEKEDG